MCDFFISFQFDMHTIYTGKRYIGDIISINENYSVVFSRAICLGPNPVDVD